MIPYNTFPYNSIIAAFPIISIVAAFAYIFNIAALHYCVLYPTVYQSSHLIGIQFLIGYRVDSLIIEL